MESGAQRDEFRHGRLSLPGCEAHSRESPELDCVQKQELGGLVWKNRLLSDLGPICDPISQMTQFDRDLFPADQRSRDFMKR